MSIMRNGEQYYDPTAGAALERIERVERMDYKAGDIVTATKDNMERKFIILANDGYVLTGATLMTKDYDTFIPIICGGKMYVNPYRIEYLVINNWSCSLVRVATDAELNALRGAIASVLQIPTQPEAEELESGSGSVLVSEAEMEMVHNQAKELIEARTEARVYHDLFYQLWERITE